MRVALFVTCLVDFFRPNIGFACVKLLEELGCRVEIPSAQTCCGQPAYNNGDRRTARAIAAQLIDTLSGYDFVVVPSGSCGGMIKRHYPLLCADDPLLYNQARKLAARTHDITAFLADVLQVDGLSARYDGIVTYHDSCSSLRELGISEQPRRLLSMVDGLRLSEMPDIENCCGFGGTFCVKYPEISRRMLDTKCAAIARSGADTLLAGDLGCLMHIAGLTKRMENPLRVYHTAEVLAGMTDDAGIGGPS